ncbi:PepSY domain-containing protein [Rhodopseudomonas boonkerdii]|uniref:PepSY domain-containing protein n=1 Tax=Rhodopseudomonas boonkerdii TaxID=475937 RepID=UPI001E5EE82F|nr:PepSY domain-containing protein [Rhodopseudomonas boonkerdii]
MTMRASVITRNGILIGTVLGALIAGSVTMPSAIAKDDKSDCKRAQDCALQALRSGEIRPLNDVLAIARDKLPGEIIKIELDRDDGIWVYEIKVLTESGKRREIEINAQTLAVIKID